MLILCKVSIVCNLLNLVNYLIFERGYGCKDLDPQLGKNLIVHFILCINLFN